MLPDQAGIDSIEVSGNGTSVSGIRAHKNEGYFVPFAAKLAEEVDVPVIVVGGMRSKDIMEAVMNETIFFVFCHYFSIFYVSEC
jgi:2,4-dienoyl-CoA reductase-like NADH-dependent reductase (Old Yellow Enzyme family)